MANLTLDQAVVTRERSDVTPAPSHSLVVYKKVGETGRQHYATLPPGDVFKPRLLDRRFGFVCHAVNQDSNQRLTFSRKLKSVDQIHYFTLHLTLHYGVSNATLLVDLLKSDPLRRLQQEASKLLGSAVANIAWADVRSKSFNSNVVLERAHANEDHRYLTNFQYLLRFAAQLGLDLRSIKLGRSIQREDLVIDISEKKRVTQSKLKSLRHLKTVDDKRL